MTSVHRNDGFSDGVVVFPIEENEIEACLRLEEVPELRMVSPDPDVPDFDEFVRMLTRLARPNERMDTRPEILLALSWFSPADVLDTFECEEVAAFISGITQIGRITKDRCMLFVKNESDQVLARIADLLENLRTESEQGERFYGAVFTLLEEAREHAELARYFPHAFPLRIAIFAPTPLRA